MLRYPLEQVVTAEKASSIPVLIDFSKGLAIVWVYLFHFRLLGFGWQGVHLFIVFSGLTLTYSRLKQNVPSGWREWFFKRLRRILPTYWLVAFLGYLVVVCSIALQENLLLQSFWLAKRTLFFDLTLLKSFHHQELSTFPNVSLWFIPFILSCYLVFPALYQGLKKCRTPVQLLLFLTGMIGIEFVYRALAIYWLDGNPIAYDPLETGLPFDKIPDSQFPVQLSVPFAFVPSRIGEFGLGMVLGTLLARAEQPLSQVIANWRIGAFGFLVWLFSNYLINTGILGWVVGDFLIAFGLILWVLYAASLVNKLIPSLFSKLSQIGGNSYYVFLIHAIFIQVIFTYLDRKQGSPYAPFSRPILTLICFSLVLALTVVSSQALKKFDQSRLADWVARNTFAKLIR